MIRFALILIAGGFIGALIDMRTRDYLVEREATELGQRVDETLAHCDANYDRMREMIAKQTSAPCASCRP